MQDTMRTFEHFPEDAQCPICNSYKDAECWLMVIDGTENDGIAEARPVHVDCTGRHMIGRMRYNRVHGIVYCFVGK